MSAPTNYTGKVARGAASELIASAHLMSLGYHVFRAVASSCPVDLVAYLPGEVPLRVEVKTAVVRERETHTPFFSVPSNDQWDLLAVVGQDGLVVLLQPQDSYGDLRDAYCKVLGFVRRPVGAKTHCKRGHEFTPESTRLNARGFKTCRTCAKLRRGTRPRVTDGAFPSAATATATKEQTVDETVDVDATTEVAG